MTKIAQQGRDALTAPFPYYGGKRRFAELIWDRLGDPDIYAEPFFGSGAVLLARPHKPRAEVVADTNGFICNAYKAIMADPEGVALYADYPSYHHDLTARHIWLMGWGREHQNRLIEDPKFYDVQAAGWWIWGMSNWVGSGFCAQRSNQRPWVAAKMEGGQGVSAHRTEVYDKTPSIQSSKGGGRGTTAQRAEVYDKRPDVKVGQGVQLGRRPPTDKRPNLGAHPTWSTGVTAGRLDLPPAVIGTGERLMPWFHALANRLANVVVLNRPWESCVTPSVLRDLQSNPHYSIAVFMDPPYLTDGRNSELYNSDLTGESDDVAVKSWNWSAENGKRYRISYACHDGDFDLPAGWEKETLSFGGIRKESRRERMDCVMFSPACEDDKQPDLFANVEAVT